MKSTGEWGMPLPPNLSPFGYNETVAQEFYPLTEEQAQHVDCKWAKNIDEDTSAYQGPTVELSDDIADIDDDITEKILLCEETGQPFKIIPHELKLYRQKNLPLPRTCFDQRHLARIARRNPRQLWSRECAKCGKAVESSFSADRKETIYCEGCYLEEMN